MLSDVCPAGAVQFTVTALPGASGGGVGPGGITDGVALTVVGTQPLSTNAGSRYWAASASVNCREQASRWLTSIGLPARSTLWYSQKCTFWILLQSLFGVVESSQPIGRMCASIALSM